MPSFSEEAMEEWAVECIMEEVVLRPDKGNLLAAVRREIAGWGAVECVKFLLSRGYPEDRIIEIIKK